MFFVGTQTRPEAFNRQFAGLAPCKLDKLVDVVLAGDRSEGLALGEVDVQNPIFQPFSKPYYGDFTRVHFKRYFDVTDSQAAQVLARFDDRKPAVLFKRIGKGMSLLVVSSADLEMNDFCLRGVFLPFVHQSVRLLAAYGDTGVPAAPTGTEISTELPADVTSATLTSPGGASETISPAKKDAGASGGRPSLEANGSGKPLVRFKTDEQGVYRLTVGSTDRLFAANLDPREGDLAKIERDEVMAALTARRGTTEEKAVRVETARLQDEDIEKGQGVGWILLLLTAGILAAEMALADRITGKD
jgi:hypothetical protein